MEDLAASTKAIGTVSEPVYYPGYRDSSGGVHQRLQYFTHTSQSGLVSGTAASVLFEVPYAAEVVWPVISDFNLWQNAYGHFYSSAFGLSYDSEIHGLGARLCQAGSKSGEWSPFPYQVLRVIPEYGMAVYQPVPQDGSNGGISRGFHLVTLNEMDEKTVISIIMEHATGTNDLSIDEALAFWRNLTPEWQRKWRESFVPELLRKLSAVEA